MSFPLLRSNPCHLLLIVYQYTQSDSLFNGSGSSVSCSPSALVKLIELFLPTGRKMLARRGYERYVAGVPAYSTLGWFDDRLLSTFISCPEPRLAELLLHEIASGSSHC